MNPTTSLNTWEMGTSLFGGLALFLYGMHLMTEGLKASAGSSLKNWLAKITTNRFTGVLAGATVTALLQSSTVTTVLLVGFVSAGLMTSLQAAGVILGANVGTTITAQIIAFKVTRSALVLVAIGFLVVSLSRMNRTRGAGLVALGLGLVFLGMDTMATGTYPLGSHPPFLELMQSLSNPAAGVLVGALATALLQSSSATTGIVIVLASQGLIGLPAGVAVILGSNVGTCATAMLSALGKPREAVKAAVVHVLFNLLGVLIWVWFIDTLSWSASRLADAEDIPRQIAHAHTLFNVANTLIFIWFIKPLDWLADRIVQLPGRKKDVHEVPIVQFLSPLYLQEPETALDRVRMECASLGLRVLDMVRRSIPQAVDGTEAELVTLQEDELKTDIHHAEIINFLGMLALRNSNMRQSGAVGNYLQIANYFEAIADIVVNDTVDTGQKRIQRKIRISPETRDQILTIHQVVVSAGEHVLDALGGSGYQPDSARAAIESKKDFDARTEQLQARLALRLGAEQKVRVETFKVESNLVEECKRMHTLFRRTAKQVEALSE